MDNAPIEIVHRIANDDSIAVAQPVLSRSMRLTSGDLVEIAKSKSQQHLLAIAGRQHLSSVVTDVLVDRGDRDVRYRFADNASAGFSESGFAKLVGSAEKDDALTERIGLRIDLPLQFLRELLQKTEKVRARLLALASAEQHENIQRALAKVTNDVQRELANPRDLKRAVGKIELLKERGQLDEALLLHSQTPGKSRKWSNFAAMTAVPAELVAPVMKSGRTDGLMVICRAAGLRWSTARTILESRIVKLSMTEDELSAAEREYSQLSRPAAQRTLRFWKVRAVN